jgi:hypothetical protein
LQATIQEAVLECTKAKPLPEEKKRLYVAVANKVIERRGQPSGKSCFDRNTVRPHAGKEHSATF